MSKQGLFGKFILEKANGSPIHPDAKYIVLRYDATNDEDGIASRKALIVYARAISQSNPTFAADLLEEMANETCKAFTDKINGSSSTKENLKEEEEKVDTSKQNKLQILLKATFTSDLPLSKFVELLELDKTKDLVGLDFGKTRIIADDLTDFNFTNCNFAYSDFGSSILQRTNFTKCNLTGARFENSKLFETNFTEAKIPKIVFTDAKFVDTIFTNSNNNY